MQTVQKTDNAIIGRAHYPCYRDGEPNIDKMVSMTFLLGLNA